MKIAIHKQNGGFYDRWIEYCKNNNITYENIIRNYIIHSKNLLINNIIKYQAYLF